MVMNIGNHFRAQPCSLKYYLRKIISWNEGTKGSNPIETELGFTLHELFSKIFFFNLTKYSHISFYGTWFLIYQLKSICGTANLLLKKLATLHSSQRPVGPSSFVCLVCVQSLPVLTAKTSSMASTSTLNSTSHLFFTLYTGSQFIKGSFQTCITFSFT